MKILMGILFLVVMIAVNGCSAKVVSPKVDVPAIEEALEEKVFTDEDTLSTLVLQLQEEMRVFDVVEHHDALLLAIEERMTGTDEDVLKKIATEVVVEYMNGQLEARIIELLSELNEMHSIDERDWVFHQISTQSLYRFIILYEVAYYKDKWDW